MGKVIAVTSGKGGAGKSTMTAGISSYLAVMGRRVLAVDADIGLCNLDVLLGMHQHTAFDFHDVMMRRCSLNDAVKAHPTITRLSLLGAPNNIPPQDINANIFKSMIEAMKPYFDYIFVDAAAGVDTAFHLAISAADMVLVVTNTELISLRDAARVNKLLMTADKSDARLIVNRVRPHQIMAGEASNIDEVIDTVGLPLIGLVPEDETVIACANHASPLILQGQTNAGQAILDIARRLDGNQVPLPKKIKASASQFVEIAES